MRIKRALSSCSALVITLNRWKGDRRCISLGKGQLMSEEDMEEKVANVIYHLYGSLSEGFRTIQVMENILECAKKSLYECELMDSKKT